jgi:hypothetical protein
VTLSGIEPATFWFVAQCLNHYATACPLKLHVAYSNESRTKVKINIVVFCTRRTWREGENPQRVVLPKDDDNDDDDDGILHYDIVQSTPLRRNTHHTTFDATIAQLTKKSTICDLTICLPSYWRQVRFKLFF